MGCGEACPARFVDARFVERKALAVIAEAEQRERQIEPHLRTIGRQCMGSSQMRERTRPVSTRIENAGDDAMGVGAAVVLGHGPSDKLIGKIEPPKLEKLAGALCQNPLRG
jgi:hypothetical protein